MGKNIVVIDTFSTNHHHQVFNFCMLYALAQTYKSHSITFYGDQTACEHVKSMYTRHGDFSSNLEFRSLTLLRAGSSPAVLLKFFKGAFISLRLLYRHRKDELFFFQLNPFFAFMYPLWKNLFRRQVHIICHGELEYLLRREPLWKPVMLYRFLLKRFFSYRFGPHLKLVVLGESIKRNLARVVTSNVSVLSIAHPYIFGQNRDGKNLPENGPLIIGVAGAVSVSKGFGELVRLAGDFREQIESGRLVFRVIGHNKIDSGNYPLIEFIGGAHQFLDYETYNREIAKTHALLYLYPLDSYRLIASGAVFDAVKHNKYVLALANDYFTQVFKDAGSLGFLGQTIDDLRAKISELLEDRKGDWPERHEHLIQARQLYHYKTLFLPFNLH